MNQELLSSSHLAVPAGSIADLALESAYTGARSALDDSPFLLIDLSIGNPADPELQPRIVRWLTTHACPVIGIGDHSTAPAIASACDIVLDDQRKLDGLIANILNAPIAATALVQVLRTTQDLPAEMALTIESLAYSTLQAGPEFRKWSELNPPAPNEIPTDDGPAVHLDRRGSTLQLMLNRPSSRNAMTVEMRDALVECFEFAAMDDSIERIDVSGLGSCFSTGGALKEFGTAGDPATAHVVRSIRLPAASLLRSQARIHFHVHGACIGSGIELPAFAHHLTANSGAFFQLPEIRFGLIPGAGGCVSIARRIGRQRTAYFALSARRINAATALRWGLIDEILPD